MIEPPAAEVWLVTDRTRLSPDARTTAGELAALREFIEAGIGAGLDGIQIRERDLCGRDLLWIARGATAAAAGTTTRVVVNDRIDVALAADADGVHLRGDGPPPARVRAIRDRWLIGRSVHEGDAAPAWAGADYVVFGAVFPSLTKGRAHPAIGLGPLERLARVAGVPVLAIGGITPERAAQAVGAGAAGVAGIGVFLPPGRAPEALGVAPAVAAIREAIQRHAPAVTRCASNLLE